MEGLGLEEHEGPYLRGGSADTILTGHVFTDEPGVYIEGEVGVRLEDSFYVSAEHNGESVLLTERVGGQAVSPWLIWELVSLSRYQFFFLYEKIELYLKIYWI